MSISDLRCGEDQKRSRLDAGWLIQFEDDDGTTKSLPVCSFGSPKAAAVVLFLVELEVKPQDTTNPRFWAEWTNRAYEVVNLMVSPPTRAGAMQPAVAWKVLGGVLEKQFLVTMASAPLIGKHADSIGFVAQSIEQILFEEASGTAEISATGTSRRPAVVHRSTRFGIPHRPQPGPGRRSSGVVGRKRKR